MIVRRNKGAFPFTIIIESEEEAELLYHKLNCGRYATFADYLLDRDLVISYGRTNEDMFRALSSKFTSVLPYLSQMQMRRQEYYAHYADVYNPHTSGLGVGTLGQTYYQPMGLGMSVGADSISTTSPPQEAQSQNLLHRVMDYLRR